MYRYIRFSFTCIYNLILKQPEIQIIPKLEEISIATNMNEMHVKIADNLKNNKKKLIKISASGL